MSMPETAWRVALGEVVSGVVPAWAKLLAKLSVMTAQVKLRWPPELPSVSSPIQEFPPIEPACVAAELPMPTPSAQRWQWQ